MSNFILTWVYCGKPTIIQTGDVRLLQITKKRLKNEIQYKNGFFEIRTIKGFEVKPILKYK